MDKIKCDVLIIGGGVVGMSLASKIAKDGFNCILVEAEEKLGLHASSRNNKVLEAGIYYQSNTLKHRLCVEGKNLLYDYLKVNNIRHEKCGEIIFSTDEAESLILKKFHEQAKSSSVAIERVTQKNFDKLPNFIKPIEAIYTPETGIFDSSQFLVSLSYFFEQADGLIAKSTKLEKLWLEENSIRSLCASSTEKFYISSKVVINAAGGHALKILKMLYPKKYKNFSDYFLKCHYFKLKNNYNVDKLYFIPFSKNCIGLNLIIDCFGNTRFGLDKLFETQLYDYTQQVPDRDIFKNIKEKFNGINLLDLKYEFCGNSSKIKIDGKLIEDFMIVSEHEDRFINLLGIDSPGLTSSLALANLVSSKFF